ncbi:DUF1501 domain-containing protein [Planctomicrobium sp. SH661]|uniref:DUF1501 domain-containing protein n=1 Tax=Planctomicrobium sp. SH661 TaxID=3448124 RepID=UPI003F5C6184
MTSLFTTYTRRGWLTQSAGLLMTGAMSNWLGRLALANEGESRPKRSCLLLWMDGGPSQTDTFDMKCGHANGGPFQQIGTSAAGVGISEHLPGVAKWMDRLSIVRSMSTREGDHGRARDNLRTGYTPQGAIQFPVLGSLVSNEWGPQPVDLPNYVSILPRGLFRAGSPASGYLGADHAPLLVGGDPSAAKLNVENRSLPRGVSSEQASARMELLQRMQADFLKDRPGHAADGHREAYARSLKLMSPSAAEVFELDSESPATHERYGTSAFGQGCLLARRLIERQVPFVEVTLGGWDTHNDNFAAVKNLSDVLDRGWSSLLQDLEERGLLESTVVVWMGEFGRTPVINPQVGRDHYPRAWSVVLGGGGIQGGGVIGKTGEDGLDVEDRPVSTPDLLATICLALGLDPANQNMSNVSRPIRLVDPAAKPIVELL